ncbi:ribosomal protein L37AE/L43A [Neobacillus niacini]|nr:ribosomal protein L37AE/L43A [Neobacillus niacini]
MRKSSKLKNNYRSEIVEEKEIRKMNRLLLAKNTPDNPDLLQHFKLTSEDLKTGVHCHDTKCSSAVMRYHAGTWTCPVCKMKSKTAHHQKIYDYFLLIKPSITNAEARKLLQIKSRKIIHKLITAMNLPCTGKFKGRVYHQPTTN